MIFLKKTWTFSEDNFCRQRCEQMEVIKYDHDNYFFIKIKWSSGPEEEAEADIDLKDQDAKSLYLFLKEYFDNERI